MEGTGAVAVAVAAEAAVATGGGWNTLLCDSDELLTVLLTVSEARIPNMKPVESLLTVSEGIGADAKGREEYAETAAVFSGKDGFTPNIKSEEGTDLVTSPAETAIGADGNVLDTLVVARRLSQEAHLTAVLLFCTMQAEHLMKSFSHILFTFGTAAAFASSGLSQDTHLVALFELGTMHTLHFTLSVLTVAQILTADTDGGFSDVSVGLITATLVFETTLSWSGNAEEALGKLDPVRPLRILGGEKRY